MTMTHTKTTLLVACLGLVCSGAVCAQTTDLPVQGVRADTVKKAWDETKNTQDLSPSARQRAQDATKNDPIRPKKATPTHISSPIERVSVNRNGSVLVRPGQNQAIPIAIGQPNRLITPFANPQVISTVLSGGRGKDCGEVCIRDSVVYITTDRTYPVTAFITEKDREDLAISVTMIPEAVPPREVTLKLPQEVLEKSGSPLSSKTRLNITQAQAWETDQPYIASIKKTFRKMALGEVPSGYGLRAVKNGEATPICRQDGLKFSFHPGQILEGSNMDYYVGTVENVSDKSVEFLEQHCGGWRIAAVSSYPLKLLEPGQTSEVYIAVRHPEDVAEESVRTPLIERKLP